MTAEGGVKGLLVGGAEVVEGGVLAVGIVEALIFDTSAEKSCAALMRCRGAEGGSGKLLDFEQFCQASFRI